MIAKLRAIKAELRYRMHQPVALVGAWLQKVVVGYYQYHAIPGNLDRLRIFGQRLRRLWRLVLSRRSRDCNGNCVSGWSNSNQSASTKSGLSRSPKSSIN